MHRGRQAGMQAGRLTAVAGQGIQSGVFLASEPPKFHHRHLIKSGTFPLVRFFPPHLLSSVGRL